MYQKPSLNRYFCSYCKNQRLKKKLNIALVGNPNSGKTSLFNVLTGDMSLVGPRPHALQHDEVYAKGISDYYARHNIKPGITGLAQVRGFRGETKEIDQMTKRIESDIEYINNWSIWLDLSILARTTTAFTGKGAY